MAGHNLFDSAANARRAEQHAELGPQLGALTEAIEIYDASTNAKPLFAASKTAPLFVPLLVRDSLPSWIDVKERLGRFFAIANMEMGEIEAGEYGVELVARILRRTVDFEGEEAQFVKAVRSLVRLVYVEPPKENQAKPADALQPPVFPAAEQPLTPPVQQQASPFPTPAPRYDSSAIKGEGRAADREESVTDEERQSQTPSPWQGQEGMRETASAAADNDSASQMKVEEVEEDLPDAGVVRQPSKGVSQRVPIDSANQILNNFPDIPLYVVSKLAPPDDLVFPSEMDLMFTRKVTGT
ncbi:hypothetical protein AAT19DRAFT_9663 [Rhodotorula toruloides]|uniref:Uncharacterized protein n=1 Tax=Rhodotorula toruloides TaxID=5286 RepID=A0A2T0A2T0_RHOTO|nr:hypothetical protein AAT19DRAFT_9663 [Rhodotorula toruloides]